MANCRSVFVRFMLGKVSVKMWKKSEQLLFRDEYNKFKLRTTWIFILWPLLQLFAFSHPLVWTAHQLWLLYYYMSLSLRENILQANGSNIHNWWIYHHYISLLISTVSLLFPAGNAIITSGCMFCRSTGSFSTNRIAFLSAQIPHYGIASSCCLRSFKV